MSDNNVEKAVNNDSASVEKNIETKDITINQNVISTLGETLGNGEAMQLPPFSADYISYSQLAKLV